MSETTLTGCLSCGTDKPSRNKYCDACRPKFQRNHLGHRVYVPTPEIDEQIRVAYAAKAQNRRAVIELAEKLRWNKWNVTQRACQLGIAKTKEAPWSRAEIEILEECPWISDGRMEVRIRKAGFKRTEIAIHLKRKRLRLSASIDGYSMRKLSEAFGVDCKMVGRWVKFGYLSGTRRGTNRTETQGGDIWYFTQSEVHRFIMAHPDEIDLSKVEKFWFLDCLTKGQICR